MTGRRNYVWENKSQKKKKKKACPRSGQALCSSNL